MNKLFEAWIFEKYPTAESAKNKCAEATLLMTKKFPQLRRVRGRVLVGRYFRPHWWCVTPDGEIVDPTAHQWELYPLSYEAFPDDMEEPHGKCVYCGNLLYKSRGADSHLCENCVNKPTNWLFD